MDVARAIASSPLKAAGYEYVSLDCGYSTGFRGSDGSLTVNTTRYPHGMKWLGDEIHALGLKFGMYSDAGTQQCCSRFYGKGVNDGSLGYEKQDALTFAR
jgi:alpha-galactosidase